MSLERPLGQEKRKQSGLIEATALATVLLSTVDQSPAQALEIPQKTSWNTAITEIVRDAVDEENEHLVVFVGFRDGTFVWPQIVSSSHTNELKYTFNEEFAFMLKNFEGKHVESRCQIHTHPRKSTVVTNTRSGEKYLAPYSPPSPQDVSVDNARFSRGVQDRYDLFNAPIGRDVYAAADFSGIWYYRPTSRSVEFSQKDLKEWTKAISAFTSVIIFDDQYDFNKEHEKLREAYQKYLHADVRFVPYENIEREPPCAGVDYKAETESHPSVTLTREEKLQEKEAQDVPLAGETVDENTTSRRSLGDISGGTRRRLGE